MLMRKFKVGLAAVLILGIVALFFVINAFAQSASERLNCPSGLLGIIDVQEGVNVECVNALFATLTPTTSAPTDTPVPPTPIPPTPIPATPTPEGPWAGSPLCPTHNDRAWHGLFDYDRGCHYNHEHKGDPHALDGVLGTDFYSLAGGEISYPWQTFRPPGGPGNMENDFKHEQYGWLVSQDEPCRGGEQWCVPNWRLQFHAVMSADGAVVREHSFYLQAQICNRDGEDCGTASFGGWGQYGMLMVPDGNHIPLPNDPTYPGWEENGGRRRVHNPPGGGYNTVAQWYQFSPVPGGFTILAHDAWGPVNPENPSELLFYCPGFQCDKNNSRIKGRVRLTMLEAWAVDGKINMSGYMDRHRNIVQGCSEPGLDCVPFEFVNMPTGTIQGKGTGYRDYDSSPDGAWWIEYPN